MSQTRLRVPFSLLVVPLGLLAACGPKTTSSSRTLAKTSATVVAAVTASPEVPLVLDQFEATAQTNATFQSQSEQLVGPRQLTSQTHWQSPWQRPIDRILAFRTIDGKDNHFEGSMAGAAHIDMPRLAPPSYADGRGIIADSDLPNARLISNIVSNNEGSQPNTFGTSDYLWQWGQFIDHDITLTETADPTESAAILIPRGDRFFDPQATGTAQMTFSRSAFHLRNGVRQQENAITAFLDASHIYGSDLERANALRTLDGTGKLKVSAGNLLPFNTAGLPNEPSAEQPNLFLAGDIRANEQLGLLAMHTLFVREHNQLAKHFAGLHPYYSGEAIYQMSRAIVAGLVQQITYEEFLPLLLGRNALPSYQGFDPNTDPAISNEFATAAFRFGHSGLSPTLLRLGQDNQPIAAGNIALLDAFFRPDRLASEGGIDPILRGLGAQLHQTIDPIIIDDVRNFLFGPPGAGGFDLAARNIQRGRDHGLASYNETRRSLGLPALRSFNEISSDARTVERLRSAYNGEIEAVDLWVGGLSEESIPGAMVGETFFLIIRDQFHRLRAGDRLWYKNQLSGQWRHWISTQTLASVIKRNTAIGQELSDTVFLVP